MKSIERMWCKKCECLKPAWQFAKESHPELRGASQMYQHCMPCRHGVLDRLRREWGYEQV